MIAATVTVRRYNPRSTIAATVTVRRYNALAIAATVTDRRYKARSFSRFSAFPNNP